MMKRILLVGFLMLAAAATGRDLIACGDKFLIVGRGTRFQRAATRTPASILVYANPTSNLPRALANLPVDETLRKAGYKPTTVTSAAELEAALGRGGWDLVLADVSDSAAVRGRLRGDTGPLVLPVVFNATGGELAQAKKQYAHVLKSPTKNQSFLDAIDDALAARARERAKSGSKTGD
jgi:hypothetical protein